MKRITSIVLMLIFVLLLSSCSLAKGDAYYQTNGGKETKDYYIPSGIEFSVYQGDDSTNKIDVSDYFYVAFGCPDQTVFDNCSSVKVGKSMEASGISFHTHESIINDIQEATIHTTTIELTLYALKGNDLSVWYSILLENELGDIQSQDLSGANFYSGLTLSGLTEGLEEDGTIHRLDYTIHFETIDVLDLVTIKEFDENDNLLKETLIDSEHILEELVVQKDTAYYFVIEDYIDEEGNPYQERTYHDTKEAYYYLYKYTNEYGFLEGNHLKIDES